MAKPKKRKAKRRQNVKRAERTPATPETLKKLQRDALQDLLGKDGLDGISAGSVEALLQIEAAFHIIERIVSGTSAWIGDRIGGAGSGEISDYDARWWAIWNIWATKLFRMTKRTGIEVATIVEARRATDLETVTLLRQAATLWERERRDYDDAQRTDTRQRHTIMEARECR